MGDKFGRDSIWETHWAREMLSTDTELEVSLGEQVMSLNEIMNLKVGSTLKLRTRPEDPLTLYAGDVALLRGRVGRIGDKMAIRIDEWLDKKKKTK
jgi:flagellar motor switch protein FliM